jgi:uncharacterized membrane protein required for colicin V production
VNWVDVIIILVVIGAGIRGFFVGAIRQIFGLIGLVVGFILGVAIAPALSSDVTHANWRPLLALVIIMLIAALGSALGSALGNVVAKFAHAILLGLVDRVAGAVVSVVAALLFCWLVAGVLATVTWSSVATQIQNSSVLRAVALSERLTPGHLREDRRADTQADRQARSTWRFDEFTHGAE